MRSIPFLDLTLTTPAANLALDEALLLTAEAGQGGEILRLWEWPSPAVILGAGCRLADDVIEEACQADGVPILRRASGGGTVLLGAGCLCYSLVLAYERSAALESINASYRYILERIGKLLAKAVPGVEQAGTSDLVVAGRKFSGNSQQRKRRFLLHHGTILYGFDLELVGRYLHFPARRPEYRGCREHGAFLMNLPLDITGIKHHLLAAWASATECSEWPESLVNRLALEKYERWQWTRRR